MKFPKPQKTKKKHNQAIEDAVILGVITEIYATEQYPLAPFYAQKLPYLLHRHIEGLAKGYYKLPAGPYNPSYKYRTALPIALKNHYVVEHKAVYKGHEYVNLTIGEKALEAKKYFIQWHGEKPLEWIKQFQRLQNRRDDLELLTTVDMAMVELRHNNISVTVPAVKKIIEKSEKWKAKLKRGLFSDENIDRAIKWSNDLFGQESNPE
jgi:type I restriction enzyme S subunit